MTEKKKQPKKKPKSKPKAKPKAKPIQPKKTKPIKPIEFKQEKPLIQKKKKITPIPTTSIYETPLFKPNTMKEPIKQLPQPSIIIQGDFNIEQKKREEEYNKKLDTVLKQIEKDLIKKEKYKRSKKPIEPLPYYGTSEPSDVEKIFIRQEKETTGRRKAGILPPEKYKFIDTSGSEGWIEPKYYNKSMPTLSESEKWILS